MRIAFISTMAGMPWGGSEALWSATAKRALEKGHQIFFSTTRWPQCPEKLQQLIKHGAMPFFRRSRKKTIASRLLARVGSLPYRFSAELSRIAHFRPDVILLSRGTSYDIGTEQAFVDFFLHTGTPFFIVCHSYDEKEKVSDVVRSRLQDVYSRARQVFAVSKRQAEVMRHQLQHPLPNLALVKNPVHISQANVIAFPPEEPACFAIVGLLQALKRQDMVIRILSKEIWRHRQWRLSLYGDGPDLELLNGLVSENNLQDKVFLKGYEKNIERIWSENHLLLISSMQEAAPMVLTEAQCCGRAVVATPVGDVCDRVKPGSTGWISADLSEKAYAASLEAAWQARDQWQQMGRLAHKTAVQSVDWDAEGTLLNILLSAAASRTSV